MLIERRVDFTHGYRMRCENCGAGNWLSADEYAGSPDAMMVCSECKEDFQFGRRVIELRDPDDAALGDSVLPQLAWYHTTTHPEWPPASKPLSDQEIRHYRAGLPPEEFERRRQVDENQALHIGTYEAALESMLRRMTEQDDRQSAFYLHRVRLGHGLQIEPGYRDENKVPAAKITSTTLADEGVDVIRYVNAYESMGSISLAVVRGAIESTQMIALPLPGLVTKPSNLTTEQIQTFRADVRSIRSKHAIGAADSLKSPTPLDRLRQRAYERPGGPPLLEPNEAYKVLRDMADFVADQYLDGVSPVIRDDFLHALHRPEPADGGEVDLAWLSKFIGLAALLTRPDEVQKLLSARPWRAVTA
ncbi:hypothetical protein [Pseudarthrobacter sp. AG30]|uniref:hypothetical protein n=1 Tax=Pseudarthrobacter sp. AG30 TaxID=2249742 RepID=UPI0010577ABC|nr:hypothetical protein [Pseudarthrobacter sp. AG30]